MTNWEDDFDEAATAFQGNVLENIEYVWGNNFQVAQTFIHIGGIYGFTGREWDTPILYACGKSHNQKNNSSKPSDMGRGAPISKAKSTQPVSTNDC